MQFSFFNFLQNLTQSFKNFTIKKLCMKIAIIGGDIFDVTAAYGLSG